MQSPLTPQRGRIESNPREYTHMECPACDELEVMPPGSRCVLAVRIAQGWKSGRPPDERGNPDTREWIFGRFSDERGKSDGIAGKKPKIRPIIHAHPPFVHSPRFPSAYRLRVRNKYKSQIASAPASGRTTPANGMCNANVFPGRPQCSRVADAAWAQSPVRKNKVIKGAQLQPL